MPLFLIYNKKLIGEGKEVLAFLYIREFPLITSNQR